MKSQIQVELEKLLPQIKRVTNMIKDAEEDWPAHFDRTNPDDLYLRIMFYQIQGKLDDVRRAIRSMVAPVLKEGVLFKRQNGRYELQDGTYFTSGESIEYLLEEPGEDSRWVSSRIEHNGEDYYLFGRMELPLQGLRVRIKDIPLWD
ncbi:DUF5348 domain-containing protein [Paenibacillus donghaensis]|uniref:DUF5348 domain-containing protein n=1 Tax=Paenibacillus donghaensis TaxID=414771 RepID=A0A2Z2KDS6_9BACL|nr:DUF5348 domain-containing protein [Paenibacillus donghaensis]ASA21985.1 hypothetical protein B9T62_15085 [Paenibacillus donghaensis]